MVNQIYTSELQLKKAKLSNTEAPFLDLHLTISDGFDSSKNYDKRDDFDFDIVNFPFLDILVLRQTGFIYTEHQKSCTSLLTVLHFQTLMIFEKMT